ncbi:MAG: biotin transporter BioY [Bacteroidota bacterium]
MNLTSPQVQAKGIAADQSSILSQLLWILGFVVATAIGARLEIPHEPVPFTLQTFFVLLSGAFLGARNGALSQLMYLGMGLLGAPVFAKGAFGLAVLLGPTGGYLLAFPVAALVVGLLTERHRSLLWTLASMAAGLLLVFASGTLHLYAFYLRDTALAFSSGFLLFTWWDLIKLGAAATIYHQVARRWPRVPSGER